MAFNSNGQISYLILDSLNHGSKYGLEIIEYISNKTHGGFIMKKPTLYSCLTRMEKKGLVSSSFWGESELGGKRHYYTITEAGKSELQSLSANFENATFDEADTKEPESENQKEPTFLQQSNLFDMVKPQPTQKSTSEEEDEDAPIENQINFFDLPQEPQKEVVDDGVFLDEQPVVAPVITEEKENNNEKIEYYQAKLENNTTKDDGVFLDENEKAPQTSVEEQNRKVFDSASEFNKYRKRKSFSENQIEMSVVYENENEDEIQKERIAELKRSLLNMKNGQSVEQPNDMPEQLQESHEEPPQTFNPQPAQSSNENINEKQEDDGVFITARMSASDVPVQRKIAPPNIDVFKDNLPAPKRNSDLEPTYKDMMSKIFERRMEKNSVNRQPKQENIPQEPQQTQQINDYNSLKRYYDAQGIDFKEYQKAPVQKTYNTNLLRFINSIILFALSGISSALIFWIVSATNHLNGATNFMYYTIPLLFLCYAIFEFVRLKTTESKKATLAYSAIVNWIIFGLATIITLIINVICGMNFETIANFLTSLLLPIISFAIVFPINHYIIKYIYERFSA